MKKLLAILLCLSMLLCFMPTAAFAEGETAYVAQIGDVSYKTLDAAIEAAADGATIILLADCETAGMNLDKNLTIDGSKVTAEQTEAEGGNEEQTPSEQKGWKITFNDKGIALWGKSLTFKNCDVVMNGIGSTPYTAEWNWMAVCASKDASLNLENAAMTMDGTNAGDAHAIYFCSNNKLNLNNSKLEIKNYKQDALEWDGGDGGYNVNLTNSTYISDHNRSGFTGTFIAKAENSKIDVINSTGNGSNGSHFEFIKSKVNFNNNGAHGLSAGKLIIDNSTVNANGNGANGIHVGNLLKVQNNSVVNIEENQCAISSRWTIPGALYVNAVEESLIDATSIVTIIENKGSGILLKSGTLNAAEGAKLTVTNNEAVKLGYGGGVNVRGQLVLPAGTILYNNHAATAGDDIYCDEKAQIKFSAVGTDWTLDDCNHAIDGWYHDGEEERWEAHEKPVYCEEYTGFESDNAISGLLALKAAHGLKAITPDGPNEKASISKSKTATNLNSNYESDITLSLPSTEQNLASDVMLVLDASKCTKDTMEATVKLLENLEVQQELGANVKVGIVMFKGNAVAFQEFEDNDAAANLKTNQELQKTLQGLIAADDPDGSKTKAAVRAYVVSHFTEEKIGYSFMNSGTNLPAGLQLAKEMLAGDTKVDDSRKYVVLVSDGSTYLYMHDNNYKEAYSRTVEPGSYKGGIYETETVERNSPATPPGNYTNKYDATKASDWLTWAEYIAENNAKFEQYDFKVEVAGEVPADAVKIPKSISDRIINSYVSVMQAAELYQELQSRYNCYYCHIYDSENDNGRNMLKALTDSERLIDAKEQGENIFQSIEKDILYLVGAGSYVKDYMGYTADYNFDFVNDASKLSMTVGQGVDAKTYPAEKIAENKYGFAPVEIEIMSDDHEIVKQYLYELEYFEGDKQGKEYFKWTFHTPVTNFTPVQLHYTVKLMNPKTESGTYGTYDADGSKRYEGLLTNNSATLYPVDSDGQAGVPEEFAKPTVSYTVGGGSYNPPTTADGTVKVVKTVSGVEIPAGYRVDVTFAGTAGTKTISLTNFAGNSGTGFLTLQPGTYTYTETATDIDGYQYIVQQGTVTVEAGKTAEILLSNVYTKDAEEPIIPDKPDKPTKPEQPTKPEDKTEVPKTGDNSALAGSALLLLLSACSIAAALRRKEEK